MNIHAPSRPTNYLESWFDPRKKKTLLNTANTIASIGTILYILASCHKSSAAQKTTKTVCAALAIPALAIAGSRATKTSEKGSMLALLPALAFTADLVHDWTGDMPDKNLPPYLYAGLGTIGVAILATALGQRIHLHQAREAEVYNIERLRRIENEENRTDTEHTVDNAIELAEIWTGQEVIEVAQARSSKKNQLTRAAGVIFTAGLTAFLSAPFANSKDLTLSSAAMTIAGGSALAGGTINTLAKIASIVGTIAISNRTEKLLRATGHEQPEHKVLGYSILLWSIVTIASGYNKTQRTTTSAPENNRSENAQEEWVQDIPTATATATATATEIEMSGI